MKRPPTDFELLKTIYELHHPDFVKAQKATQHGAILVPIDIPAVAGKLEVEPQMVFGRLYHHLQQVHGEKAEPGKAAIVFFTPIAGNKPNCINFPLLEAVLAGLWQERRRGAWVTGLAIASLLVACGSLLVALGWI